MKKILITILAFNCSLAFSQYSESDKRFILETFAELYELCTIDDSQMWGINLDLPCMVIDKETRMIIANKPDKEGLLVREGKIYSGIYSENKALGSSFTVYGGTVYAYVTHPFLFPESYLKVQLMHEIFHIIQDSLKLNPPQLFFKNAHLDDINARIYMKLEWLALEKALTANSAEEKKEHIAYALKFRSKRRSMFENESKEENYFELSEGMAEYTGHLITSKTFDDYINSIHYTAKTIIPLDYYATTFAYYSGCLYGGLLYTYDKYWNKTLNLSDDLGEILLHKSGIFELDTLIYNDFIDINYNIADIKREEIEKRDKKEKLILDYKHKFLVDTVLILKLEKWEMQMFPTGIMPLDSLGMVHQKINLFDNWGKLTVSDGGCLLNGNEASVPAKNIKSERKRIYTENWELIIDDNWTIEINNGNYILQKK